MTTRSRAARVGASLAVLAMATVTVPAALAAPQAPVDERAEGVSRATWPIATSAPALRWRCWCRRGAARSAVVIQWSPRRHCDDGGSKAVLGVSSQLRSQADGKG